MAPGTSTNSTLIPSGSQSGRSDTPPRTASQGVQMTPLCTTSLRTPDAPIQQRQQQQRQRRQQQRQRREYQLYENRRNLFGGQNLFGDPVPVIGIIDLQM
jgi:hypothetical protein